jgi:hypothetical protein
LDDEDILAAHVLLNLDEDLQIRKAPNARLGQRQVEVGANRFGERPIAVAGQYLHTEYLGRAGTDRTGPIAYTAGRKRRGL